MPATAEPTFGTHSATTRRCYGRLAVSAAEPKARALRRAHTDRGVLHGEEHAEPLRSAAVRTPPEHAVANDGESDSGFSMALGAAEEAGWFEPVFDTRIDEASEEASGQSAM